MTCRAETERGSLPARGVASWGVRVTPRERSAADLAAGLRRGEPAILARIQDDALIFDLRTLDEEEVGAALDRLAEGGTTDLMAAVADVEPGSRERTLSLLASRL